MLEDLLRRGTLSRREIAAATGMNDRSVRNTIRRLRRAGVPVMALRSGGYKLAETDAEKLELLNMYRGRAMDELITYGRLCRSLQVDGQISLERLLMTAAELGEENVYDIDNV